jgi:predicted dehydrogenase
MGRNHLRLMRDAGMTPHAVCELDEERLAVARQDFPDIETYDSVSRMLKASDVNLVAIITPHNTHAKLGSQCLRAGRHVVMEKPFAITTAECDAMIREAKKQGVMLSTYHNRHWDACIVEGVKRIKRQKAIGDIVRIEAHMGGYRQPGDWWRSSKSISGGILYDWGAHLLEYSLQLIEGDLVEVAGFAYNGHWAGKTAWKTDTNEDEAFAVVRFAGGPWLTLMVSHLDSNPKRGLLEVTGTKGSYIMDHGGFEIIQVDGARTIHTRGRNEVKGSNHYYRNVAAHLVKGRDLVITAEWARRPIHILDLAGQSAVKGKTMPAKYV